MPQCVSACIVICSPTVVQSDHVVITMLLSRKRCIQAASEMTKKRCASRRGKNKVTLLLAIFLPVVLFLVILSVIFHPVVLLLANPLLQSSPLLLKQKRSFAQTSNLIKSLGKPSITSAQAKKFDSIGLGCGDLEKLKSKRRN